MAAFVRVYMPLLLIGAASQTSSVTPVGKVVELLEGLRQEIQDESAAEALTYDQFACFCKTTTASKSSSITTGQDTIDKLSATIESSTAVRAETTSELVSRQSTQEELAENLRNTTARCAAEKATYEATVADLDKAISGLEGAQKSLKVAASPGAFLALPHNMRVNSVKKSTSSDQGWRQKFVAQLIQQNAHVDPVDPEYKFHSQGVLDTIKQLLIDYNDEKTTVNDEFTKAKQACDATESSLTDEMRINKLAIDAAEEKIFKLSADTATARSELVNSDVALKDDQAYLQDLTHLCEARAKDWDQRSGMRAKELETLSQALTILNSGVVQQDIAVNKRALVQATATAPKAKVTSFVQVSEVRKHRAQGDGQRIVVPEKVDRAIVVLREEGQRLRSASLGLVASRLAADPFAKVKDLLQALVERLLKESTEEATKKTFCDTELGKANQDRDFRHADAVRLTAEVVAFEAKRDELTQELADLNDALGTMTTNLQTAKATRARENEENTKTMKTAHKGIEAITSAISILRDFYKQSAKAKVSFMTVSWLQTSPVEVDTQGPGFEGAYKGKLEHSIGIIGLLEVIKSDFERTSGSTEAAEKAAAEDFVEFDRASRADISAKETKTKLNEEDLQTTIGNIKQGLMDLQTAQKLLDGSLKTLEDLKPMCVDLTMPYAERVQKRDAEIAALRRALCILDTEAIEPDFNAGSE